jgi:hypothetical protein
MIIATFGPTTAWVGRTITFENERFILEDHGPITAADIMEHDRQGHLIWASDGTRAWVGSSAATGPVPPPPAPASPTAQARLDKAREQVDKGKHKAAIETLWILEAQAREGDLGAAHGILILASELREQTSGGLREQCEDLVERAREVLDPGGLLRERVGALAVSFAPARFIGFQVRQEARKTRRDDGTLWFGEHWIGLGTPEGRPTEGETVPIAAVTGIEVSGGRVRKDTGEIVGQALVGGLVLGVAGAAMGATVSTTENRTEILVHVASGDAVRFVAIAQEPAGLREAISPLLKTLSIPLLDPMFDPPPVAASAVPAARTIDVGAGADTADGFASRSFMEELRELSRLHQSGELTDEEFAAFKAKLMG